MAENKQFLDYKGTTIIADEIKTTQNSISEVSNELQRKAIPADMAQNDSTQFDYVKNRTHYIENRINAIYSNVATFDSATSSVLLMVTEPIGLEAGKIYNVIWNGETYAVVGDKDKNGDVAIGDTQGQGQFPFLIIDAIEDYAVIVEYLEEIEEGDSLNVNFTIAENVEIIHKLDNRYLPDGVAYTTDIEENIRPYAKDVNISSTTQNVNITAATNNINLNANGNINLRGTTLPIIGTGAMTLESPNTTTVGANITMANENIYMIGGGRVEISKPTMIVNNTEVLTMVNGAMNITSTKGINITTVEEGSSGVNINTGANKIELNSLGNIIIGSSIGESNLTVNCPTTTLTGSTTIAGPTTMNRDATINGSLTVHSGRTNLHGGASIENNLYVTGNIQQQAGNTYLDGDLTTQYITAESLELNQGKRNIVVGLNNNFLATSGVENLIIGADNGTASYYDNSQNLIVGTKNVLYGSDQSFIIGNANTISNSFNCIIGSDNKIQGHGKNTNIFGDDNTISESGHYSHHLFIVGANNKTTGSNNMYNSVFGVNHLVKGHHSTITGRDNISSGDAQLIGGYLNDNDENNLFEIGNGYKFNNWTVESTEIKINAVVHPGDDEHIIISLAEHPCDIIKLSHFHCNPTETIGLYTTTAVSFILYDSDNNILDQGSIKLISSELDPYATSTPSYMLDLSSYTDVSSMRLYYAGPAGTAASFDFYACYKGQDEIGEVRQNAMSVSKEGNVKANNYSIVEKKLIIESNGVSRCENLFNEETTLYFEPIVTSTSYKLYVKLQDVNTGIGVEFSDYIGGGQKITIPFSSEYPYLLIQLIDEDAVENEASDVYVPLNIYQIKETSLKDTLKELKTITVDGVERTGVLKRAKVTVTPTVNSATYGGKQINQNESEQYLRFLNYTASAQIPLADIGITDSSKVVVLSTQTYQHEYLYMGTTNVIPMQFRCFGIPSGETSEMMLFEGCQTKVVGHIATSPSVGPTAYSQMGDVDLVIEYLELEDLPTTAAVIELSEEEMAAMVATLNEIDEVEEEN